MIYELVEQHIMWESWIVYLKRLNLQHISLNVCNDQWRHLDSREIINLHACLGMVDGMLVGHLKLETLQVVHVDLVVPVLPLNVELE